MKLVYYTTKTKNTKENSDKNCTFLSLKLNISTRSKLNGGKI